MQSSASIHIFNIRRSKMRKVGQSKMGFVENMKFDYKKSSAFNAYNAFLIYVHITSLSIIIMQLIASDYKHS